MGWKLALLTLLYVAFVAPLAYFALRARLLRHDADQPAPPAPDSGDDPLYGGSSPFADTPAVRDAAPPSETKTPG